MTVTTHRIGSIELSNMTDLNLGPVHPTRPGVTILKLEHDHGMVSKADLQPGYLHRGAEKLFEVRDYRSVLMLADRHDWLSAFSGELVVALTVEQAMGLVPPTRATWLRTAFAETARLHSHLSYLSYLPFIGSQSDLHDELTKTLNNLREAFASCCGNRVHPMLNRLGGLSHEPSLSALQELGQAAASADPVLSRLEELLSALPQLRVGRLGSNDVDQFGLSGPTSAASGIRLDLRDQGYLSYHSLPPIPKPTNAEGDAKARFGALIQDSQHSLTLVDKVLNQLPPGPVNVKLAKIIKVPEGIYTQEVAAPWGVAGAHLVSRGERTPWRLGLRTPTFANCSALARALPGTPVDSVGHVIASLGYGIGDLDR